MQAHIAQPINPCAGIRRRPDKQQAKLASAGEIIRWAHELNGMSLNFGALKAELLSGRVDAMYGTIRQASKASQDTLMARSVKKPVKAARRGSWRRRPTAIAGTTHISSGY